MTLRCDGWCGECYSNARGRTNFRGHLCYRRPRAPRVLKPWEKDVRKPQAVGMGAVGGSVPSVASYLSPYPLVWEYLTDDAWEDGTPRQRASLMIVADGGSLKLWLNDRALDRSCWVSGESLEDALSSLEGLLYSDSAPWRGNNSKKAAKK